MGVIRRLINANKWPRQTRWQTSQLRDRINPVGLLSENITLNNLLKLSDVLMSSSTPRNITSVLHNPLSTPGTSWTPRGCEASGSLTALVSEPLLPPLLASQPFSPGQTDILTKPNSIVLTCPHFFFNCWLKIVKIAHNLLHVVA